MDPDQTVTDMIDTMPTAGWLLVWNIGPLGDCACPRRFGCPRPGKHPHLSFEHGALSAVQTRAEAEARRSGSARLAVVPGDQLIILDIDNDRAWRAFVRHLAGECQPVATARSVKGWHIYLPCEMDGWTMGSVGAWMKSWMQRNDLYGIEYRVGTRSYAVWPEGLDGRHWVSLEHFAQRVVADTPDPVQSVRLGKSQAPWATTAEQTVRSIQANHAVGSDLPEPDEVNALDPERTWERFELACSRLAEAPEGTRNNTLNQVAYYQGAEALWTGWNEDMVRDTLATAYWAERPHDAGGTATITSGLRAGTSRLMKAVTG